MDPALGTRPEARQMRLGIVGLSSTFDLLDHRYSCFSSDLDSALDLAFTERSKPAHMLKLLSYMGLWEAFLIRKLARVLQQLARRYVPYAVE